MVTPADWWDFQPGTRVDTPEGYPGVVESVLDGPGPGNEAYQVTLDDGQGGGVYGAHELSPRTAGRQQTTVAHTDYPELGDILVRKPPPPVTLPFEDYIAGLYQGSDPLYGPVTAARVTAGDGGDHSGSAMVAIPIPPDVAAQGAVDGGLSPESMHVTLAYLPNPSEQDLDITHSIVHDIAASHPALTGSVGGAGQFPAGEDGVPHYAPVDIPGLAELHSAIVQELGDAGVQVASDHAFNPHMTRTYLPEGQPGPDPMPATDVQIPHLVVAEGPDWTHYPLAGAGSTDDQPPADPAPIDKAAGFWSDMLHGTPGPSVGFDWCRFRKNQACLFPHTLDVQSTVQKQQPVWLMQNRGHCGRDFQQQSGCPIGEPSKRGNMFSGATHSGLDEHLVQSFLGGSAAPHIRRIADGSYEFTPERQALHDKIISSALAGHSPSRNPTYTILGGGPAAGKSTLVNSGRIPGLDSAVMVNPDDVKEALPEYQQALRDKDPKGAAFAHEESSYIGKRLLHEAFNRDLDVALDGTGDSSMDKLAGKIRNARDNGYRVVGHYVTVPTDMAVDRAHQRALRTGRHLPESVIRSTHANVSQIFPKAHRMMDEAHLYDSEGDTPRPVFSSHGGKATVHDPDRWQRFLDKADE